jgi:hypothetical protein
MKKKLIIPHKASISCAQHDDAMIQLVDHIEVLIVRASQRQAAWSLQSTAACRATSPSGTMLPDLASDTRLVQL